MAKGKKRVGTISVILAAHVKAFNRRMQRATNTVNDFGTRIAGISGRIAKYAAGLTTAGVGAVALMVRHSLKLNDALAKTADKLGITTEALAGFHHAAALSGVGSEDFNKAIERMTRMVSEAAAGTGEAKEAIKELGLDAGKLNLAGPESAFLQVSDAIANVGNQSDRVRLAFELFGRQGASLLNTMAGGSKGILAARMEAEKFGVAISRFEAKKLENVNDAIHRVKQVFAGVGNTVATYLAPMITDVSNRIIEWGTSGEGASGKVRAALEWTMKTVGRVADAFGTWEPIWIRIKGGVVGTLKFLQAKMAQFISWVVTNVTELNKWVLDKARAVREFLRPLADLDPTGFTGKLFQGMAVSDEMTKRILDTTGMIFKQVADEQERAFIAYMNTIQAELDAFDRQALPSEKIQAWLDAIRAKADAAAASAKDLVKATLDVPNAAAKAVTAAGGDLSAGMFAPNITAGSAEAQRAAYAAAQHQNATRKLLTNIAGNTGSTVTSVDAVTRAIAGLIPQIVRI